MEQDDQAITLASNDIIHPACRFLYMNQCINHLLHRFIENETSECFWVPFYTVKVVDKQVD